MPTHLLITRPAPDDVVFADAARGRLGCGIPIVMSPVIEIEQTSPVPGLTDQALIFTSRHGVAAYANGDTGGSRSAYVVGLSTAAAARDVGLDVRRVAQNGDDLLAQLIANPPTRALLHLRGAHVAGDIAGRLLEAGITCGEAVVYQQRACALSDTARALLWGEEPVILPLFSPRSATLLFDQGPFRAPLMIIAISQAVAAAIPPDKAVKTLIAPRPEAAAMLDLLPKALETAKPLEGQFPPQ